MRIPTLVLQVLITATLTLGLAAGVAEAAGKTKQPETLASLGPPMRFAIVRTEVQGCEPNCPQWISAEGVITQETPALLRKILQQTGKSRLPILINSPGGDLDASLAMGETIRARRLDVGVGWTFFAGCMPGSNACKLPEHQRGVYRGIPVTWRAYCFSTCPFVLAGGRKRLAGGAMVGLTRFNTTVTSQRIFYEERYRVVNGKEKLLSRKIVKREPVKSYTTTKLEKPLRRKLNTYAGKMGLGKSLVALLSKAPPLSVYFLTGKEALSAKLVTDFASARTLVDNQLCKAMPAADNCIFITVSNDQKAIP